MKPIRIGICLLIALAVLSFGAVEAWSQAIIEIGAAALLLLWGVLSIKQGHFELHWNWLYLPLLGLMGIAFTQWAFGLSAYPYATKIELFRWIAFSILCFLAVQSFQSEDELKSFAWFLLSFGFLVSLFAIAQQLTSNGKLYWVVELRNGGEPFGPFVNRDHFAGFMEFVIAMGLALTLLGRMRRDKLPLAMLLTIVPIGALILCASRGGIVSFLFEGLLVGLLLKGRTHAGSQRWKTTAFVFFAALFVAWLGIEMAVLRFETLFESDITQDQRMLMAKDIWQIFQHHPWTGTGLSTLRTVYPQYESHYIEAIVDHAHNDYLELLADTGIAGGVCGLVFIALLFWHGMTNWISAENSAARFFYAGALLGCAGLLLHGFVDFNLHIPSNALLFLILAGLVTGRVAAKTQKT